MKMRRVLYAWHSMGIKVAKKIRDHNKYVGTRWESAHNGYYKILEVKNIGKRTRCVVRFEETGGESEVCFYNATKPHKEDRRVKDWDRPCVCGWGIAFWGASVNHPIEYFTWKHMVTRVHGPNTQVCYQNVTICDEWRWFINFLRDFTKIPGFEKKLAGENVHLDKDLRVLGNMEYKLETVHFIPAAMNEGAALQKSNNLRKKKVRSILTGKVYETAKDAAHCPEVKHSEIAIRKHCRGERAKNLWEYVEE